MRTLLLLTLCLSTGALAIAKGGTLYIRSNDTAMLKEPKAKAATLMKLAQGTAVVWNGPAEKDKQWHEVMVAGKKGFVRVTDLSPNQPQQETDSASGKPMSAQAFASSGAAVKDGDMGAPTSTTAARRRRRPPLSFCMWRSSTRRRPLRRRSARRRRSCAAPSLPLPASAGRGSG